MFKNEKNKLGFTIIELLVVIGIISIVASVVVGGFDEARRQARAAKILGDARKIKDAFQSAYSFEIRYPDETELGQGANPSITTLIGANVFDGDFTTAPGPGIGSGGEYLYDADAGDSSVYDPADCNYTNNEFGVNLIVPDAYQDNQDVVLSLDTLVDGGDGMSCGKVRTVINGDADLIYMLSPGVSLFP